MSVIISNRKAESFLRAEAVARELRYQLSSASNWNGQVLTELLLQWMKVTGKVKYKRP